jgi:FAD/FMN-containing dehydrogenase
MDLQRELVNLKLEGDVYTDDTHLERCSRDASIFKIKPKAIVAVKNALDIQKIINFVNKNKKEDKSLSITARAAGTCMSGGGLNDSIILSFTEHMNKVLKIEDSSVTTEMGVYYRDLEKETLKQNVYLPSYPASRDLCAMGGIVTLRYGKTIDYVE